MNNLFLSPSCIKHKYKVLCTAITWIYIDMLKTYLTRKSFLLNCCTLSVPAVWQVRAQPVPARVTGQRSESHIGQRLLTYLLYFTLVGVVSSDVIRPSCTTSFTPCCSIFSQSYVFLQGCPCPLLDVIDVLHPGAPPSSFPRHHSENACLY